MRVLSNAIETVKILQNNELALFKLNIEALMNSPVRH